MKKKIMVRTDSKTAKATIRLFWHELRQNKWLVASYSILVPLSYLLYIVILPLLFSLIIQLLVVPPANLQLASWLLAASVGVSILAVITNTLGYWLMFRHEEVMQSRLTEISMQKLLTHSYQFFANHKVGSLAGDFSGFTKAIITLMDTLYLQASSILVNFIASLIVIAVLSPLLLIPLAFITILLVLLSMRALAERGPIRHERKRLTSQLNGIVADILGNQILVRVFAQEKTETAAVLAKRLIIEQVAHREVKIIMRETSIRQAAVFGFQILTIGVCMWLFSNHLASVAALLFTLTYLSRLTNTMHGITPIVRSIEQALLDAAPMTDILIRKADILDKPDAPDLQISRGAIEFHDVSFHYEDAKEDKILEHFSLSIKPGERVGLAGPSGGGKTTLTKLILRFIDIQSGSIMIDGQDIRDVTQTSLRSAIAYVPQEPLLFHRTLRENIAYGSAASDEQIIAAARRAHAYEFIQKLPHGLDTTVGERGVKLSGGQRQRIAIARAILKDAPILVLDEATSALDSHSEHLVQQALDELMKGRTTLVIAHRLSTIQKMDRIIVLDDGRISEQGTHSALLQTHGTYSKLWARQSGGFIEDETS